MYTSAMGVESQVTSGKEPANKPRNGRLTRRELLKMAGVGIVSFVGGGFVGRQVGSQEEVINESMKLVGGEWVDLKQGQSVKDSVNLQFRAMARDGARVNVVVFTASSESVPNLPQVPSDDLLYKVIGGVENGWKILGGVVPGPDGLCVYRLDLIAAKAPPGPLQISADAYGTERTGDITGRTINRAPNGILNLIRT